MRLACLTLSLLTVGIGINTSVLAQTPTQKNAPKPTKRVSGIQYNQPNDWVIEPLKDKVDLPNLPSFTGHAKFVTGSIHPSDKGSSYVQVFVAKEDRKLVFDWYKNTLSMYKWKITFADGQFITAELKNARCAVAVNGSDGRNGSTCQFEIDYTELNNK